MFALAATGCFSLGFDVVHVSRADDTARLAISVSTCNASYSTSVRQGPRQVDVTITQTEPGQPDAECLDDVIVDLDKPLGDRSVVINGGDHSVTEQP